MTRKRFLLILLIAMTAALVACGGSVASPAGDALPDQPTTAAELPTEPAPSAEPLAGATAEPLAGATAEPLAEATPTPTPAPAVLCPGLPRPALIVNSGADFAGLEPQSGMRCPLPLPAEAAYIAAGGDAVYYVQLNNDAGNAVVAKVGADGTVTELESTRVTNDVFYLLRFAVSAGGDHLAWSQMAPQADPNAAELLGSLWIGASDGSAAVPIFENTPGGPMHIVSPIRFSADGQTLFFSWEPIGLGGLWASFNGRYENVYRVPVTGGEPVKVFDCADAGLFLCLGDFRDDGTVAYIDLENVIHVAGPDGTELAAIPTAADYAGYPTFSPTGDLTYSEAVVNLDTEEMPLPQPGTIYRLAAPYDGAPAVVASADGLLISAMRDPFLDAERVVVSASADGQWGTGVMDRSGAVTNLEPWPNTYVMALWKNPQQ